MNKDPVFRLLLILWGVNKFTKKLIRPQAINNNELVDFISRVPDNEELVGCLQALEDRLGEFKGFPQWGVYLGVYLDKSFGLVTISILARLICFLFIL